MINIHTKEIQYPCDECEKICYDVLSLRKHKTTHIVEFNSNCSECDKSFKSAFHLKRHATRIHRKVVDSIDKNQYMCDICSSVFQLKEYLKRHNKNVHSGLLFFCSFCEKSFKKNVSLKEHEADHKGNMKTMECKVCCLVLKGSRKGIMDRHMKTHSNLSSVKCDQCEYHFRSQMSLIRHIGLSH